MLRIQKLTDLKSLGHSMLAWKHVPRQFFQLSPKFHLRRKRKLMGSLSGLQEYQVYVYNCEKFNKSAEKAPLLVWQDLIDATVYHFICNKINIFS